MLIYLLESLFYLFISSSEFLENIFLKGKRETDPDLIYQLGNLTLRALSYFHVGTSSRGSGLKPGMVPGHVSVKHGSS